MSDYVHFLRLPEITTVRALLERMLSQPRDNLVFTDGRYWFAELMGGGITYVNIQQVKLAMALDLLCEVPGDEWEGPGVGYRCTLANKS